MSTPFSSVALVCLASFIGSFGAVFLKAGALRLHRPLWSLIRNWQLAAGVLLYVVSSYFFVLGLRRGELTVLYPMVSLSYVFTLGWSRVFFREPVTRDKLLGVTAIILGIVLLSLGIR